MRVPSLQTLQSLVDHRGMLPELGIDLHDLADGMHSLVDVGLLLVQVFLGGIFSTGDLHLQRWARVKHLVQPYKVVAVQEHLDALHRPQLAMLREGRGLHYPGARAHVVQDLHGIAAAEVLCVEALLALGIGSAPIGLAPASVEEGAHKGRSTLLEEPHQLLDNTRVGDLEQLLLARKERSPRQWQRHHARLEGRPRVLSQLLARV
mmetsp:Transcript_108233/g.231083  ORF Transcript_108233/g.231083 Transcript_108233/m.231083 type:complete len:206 (+) Transcript_108233:2562-3179(+)